MDIEPVTEPQIDLFANQLPSMEEIDKISHFVNSGEKNQLDFSEQVEANLSRTGPKAMVPVGIGLYILGRYAEAAQKLKL